MLNRPKYILFILTLAFSVLTLGNVILFDLHIEDQGIFILTTLATCSFSCVSMLYLFFHFKKNYISKKVMENEDGEIDMKKLKAEIDKANRDKILLARKKQFEEALHNQKEVSNVPNFVTAKLAKELNACQAAYFQVEKRESKNVLKLTASYAYHIPESQEVLFEFGEGLTGQVAVEGKLINIKKVPDGYISVLSGLGKSSPTNLLIVPIFGNGHLKAVLELTSFTEFTPEDEDYLTQISEMI
jgi:putative methionine-R-sulfoxide reductase with GAF domain